LKWLKWLPMLPTTSIQTCMMHQIPKWLRSTETALLLTTKVAQKEEVDHNRFWRGLSTQN
jgi:hypothetical protein